MLDRLCPSRHPILNESNGEHCGGCAARHGKPRSRGTNAPEFCWIERPSLDQGGRREHRMQAAPAASCVSKKTHELVTTGTPNIPALPAQWFTAYGALSPVSGLYSHRRRRIAAGLPAWADIANSANLIPASGDQDHTFSPSASARFVVCAPKRPSHPAPNVRDDWPKRPS